MWDRINPFWKLSLVFKCLTDTIMLDDFKTELKRLGIKRLRQDELRRQSFALVGDQLGSKDDDGHMEFSTALNMSPSQLQATRDSDNSFNSSPPGRMRHDSILESRRDSKESIGRSGKKLGRLPGLESFIPGRRRSKINDEEKQPDESPTPSSAPDRLSQMRQSLGVVDYRAR